MSTVPVTVPVIMKKTLGWTIALSALMILAGFIAIVLPPVAGFGVTIVVGWLLIFSGIMHLVFAWQTRGVWAILWEILVGAVYTIVGVYILINPLLGMVSLTLALAAYLLAEAVFEFILAVRLRPRPGSGWLFVDSLITLVLAILIWRSWPTSSAWAIGLLVGISMVFSGTARLMISLAARKVASGLA